MQRLESTFRNTIYPIYESLKEELQLLHYGFSLDVPRIDIPYYTDGNNKNPLNDLVDGCVIRNLKMEVVIDPCETKFEI